MPGGQQLRLACRAFCVRLLWLQRQSRVKTERLEVLPSVGGTRSRLGVVHLEETIGRQMAGCICLEELQVLQLILPKLLAIVARTCKRLQLVDGQRSVTIYVEAPKYLLKRRLKLLLDDLARLLILVLRGRGSRSGAR